MRDHVEFVVMRSENEVEVHRHFGDVKKLAYLVLVALLTQYGDEMREHAVTVCKQETVLVKSRIQKLSRRMLRRLISHIDMGSIRNCRGSCHFRYFGGYYS
jgi:hypothetical protein